jgi:hypothetical protein
MKNVYYLSMNEDDASAFYRTSGVLSFLNSKDISVKNISNIQKTYGWENLIGADVFIFQRPYHSYHTNLILMAKDMGIKVICEYDDDLLNIPVHNISYQLLNINLHNIIESLSLADEVWVSTESIKNSFKPYNDNIHVIPNCHNDYVYPVKNKKKFNKKTKIAAYRGGASHYEDVYEHKEGIYNTINFNLDWEFRFQGSRFNFLERETGNNHTYTDPMPLMQFFKSYHDLNPNIAFFPLLYNVFNNGKSNISFLEATYAGAAFLGNRSLAEFNLPFIIPIKNGFRVDFLSIKDDYYRLKMLNNDAWDWICENRLLSNVNDKRIERILS